MVILGYDMVDNFGSICLCNSFTSVEVYSMEVKLFNVGVIVHRLRYIDSFY